MTGWRENLRPGSWRDVAFETEDHTFGGGRRGTAHEYPQRDVPYFEDMGRKARKIDLTCFIIGDDYMARRDAMVAACEKPGPGTLIHPYLGTLQVNCTDFTVAERASEGRMARFTISFVEAGELRFPAQSSDTGALVGQRADQANFAAKAAFDDVYTTNNLPGFVPAGTKGTLDAYLAQAARIAPGADLSGLITEQSVLTGQGLSSGIAGIPQAVGRSVSAVSGPKAGVAALRRLGGYDFAGPVSAVPQTTATRVAQRSSLQAASRLAHRSAIIEEARLLPGVDFTSNDDATRYAWDYRDRIDPLIMDSPEIGAYNGLTNLKAAVTTDLTARAGGLPSVQQVPSRSRPALVVAYDLYGDAGRDSEIVARNGVRHPSFMPGSILSVLSK